MSMFFSAWPSRSKRVRRRNVRSGIICACARTGSNSLPSIPICTVGRPRYRSNSLARRLSSFAAKSEVDDAPGGPQCPHGEQVRSEQMLRRMTTAFSASERLALLGSQLAWTPQRHLFVRFKRRLQMHPQEFSPQCTRIFVGLQEDRGPHTCGLGSVRFGSLQGLHRCRSASILYQPVH